MKPVAFASILIRGVALWLLINGITGVSAVFMPWPGGRMLKYPEVFVFSLRTLLPIATALLVWANADWLARRVASLEEGTALRPDWTSVELLRLVVATVGIATAARAIPDLAWYASVLVSLNWTRNTLLGPVSASPDVVAKYWDLSTKARCVETVVRATVGVALIVMPNSIATWVGRAENGPPRTHAGDEAVEQGDEADEAR